MKNTSDVHEQFGLAFNNNDIEPYATELSRKLAEGHICLFAEDLDTLKLAPFVTADPGKPAPFIWDDGRLYMQRYYAYETKVVEMIRAKVEGGRAKVGERMKALEKIKPLIQGLVADYPLEGLKEEERIDWQIVATIRAMLNDLFILVGGPGMGKTRTLGFLLQVIYAMEPDARIALAAPTGKASMRMYESLCNAAKDMDPGIRGKIEALKPSTLHSLLGYKRNSVYFKHNEGNPLGYDWVMVDETSMVDLPMMAKLLPAVGEQTRLVLIGDQNQLSSVEAGSLLGDLCKTVPVFNQLPKETTDWINGFIPDPARQVTGTYVGEQPSLIGGASVQLKLSHRFKKQGVIGHVSEAIIASDVHQLKQLISGNQDPNLVFDAHYDPKVLEQVVKGYEAFIKEKDVRQALKNLNELRVLVTVREGERGLHKVNRKIETILQQKKLINPDKLFYENRPVMITRNNYELGLFNGDVGIVRKGANDELRVWFEDANEESGVRSVNPAYLNDVETVWCMTIHKSQGSEFGTAMVILPEGKENKLLTRELIYTGVTRAKNKVVIQGSMETLEHAASQHVKRDSGIAARLGNQNEGR